MKDILTLGIESSCDETSISVVKNGRDVLSNVINTQIDIHTLYGGVVPEIASRNHILNISAVMHEALKQANIELKDIDNIAVTNGPGLVGALLVGLSYAKGLSYATKKPLNGINHIEGHIGGNTQIIHVKNYTEFEVLGRTVDDAVGEAFDKIARVIGLGYPGGPKVDKMGQNGEAKIELPKTHFDNMDFSFSGIKTAVINLHHKNPEINKADLCKSFEKTVAEILINTIKKAMEFTGEDKIVLAGGVSANTYIRSEFEKLENAKVYMPDLKLCTDNAAMIASSGYYNFINNKVDDLTLNAIPNLKL